MEHLPVQGAAFHHLWCLLSEKEEEEVEQVEQEDTRAIWASLGVTLTLWSFYSS